MMDTTICGQPLYRDGKRVGTCAEPRGVEHDHDDRADIRRDPWPGTPAQDEDFEHKATS